MKDIDIEDLLRNSKPVVKDDPTFLLETRRRMRDVEGIKDEVDRQRGYGRTVLLITLIIGMVTGIMVAATLLLFPMDSVFAFIGEWKLYLALAAAIVVVVITIFGRDRSFLVLNKLLVFPHSKTTMEEYLTD